MGVIANERRVSRFSFITFRPWSGRDFLSPNFGRPGLRSGSDSLKSPSKENGRHRPEQSDRPDRTDIPCAEQELSAKPRQPSSLQFKDLPKSPRPVFVRATSDSNVYIPPRVHLTGYPLRLARTPSTAANSVSDSKPIRIQSWSKTAYEGTEMGLKHRIVEAFRRNYCPRTSSELVLPTPPSDEEKYSIQGIRCLFLIACVSTVVAATAIGAAFASQPTAVIVWYGVYALLAQSALFTALCVALMGKHFDITAHKSFLKGIYLKESTAPPVDVYLPVCNEPLELLENTWKHVAKLEYPASRISFFVLDDGARESVKLASQRFGFIYITRPDRSELKQAGSIRHAFAQTSGQFFTVFNAGNCPHSSYWLETIPYLVDDGNRAILQTPECFRSLAHQTWVERGAGPILENDSQLTQTCLDRLGAATSGASSAIYRRTALQDFDGPFPTAHASDSSTNIHALTHGWTIKSLPLTLTTASAPATPLGNFTQQTRSCRNGASLIFSKSFWTNPLPLKQKLCYLMNFLGFVSATIQCIASPLPLPLILWCRSEWFRYYYMFYAVLALLLETLVLRIWFGTRDIASVRYIRVIAGYAYLQGFLDQMSGHKEEAEGNLMHQVANYRNMRLFACGWTFLHQGVLLAGCVYRVGFTGLEWYHLVPALAIDSYHLDCVHRFLVYQHPRH